MSHKFYDTTVGEWQVTVDKDKASDDDRNIVNLFLTQPENMGGESAEVVLETDKARTLAQRILDQANAVDAKANA